MGIPMWVFYVNRGQAISSFGVESKDHPIVEFQPANKAYRETPTTGFRTFLKIRRGERAESCEPFSSQANAETRRRMFIGMNELELQEEDPSRGLQTNVQYFTLPGESLAALVRTLIVQNTGGEPVQLEILDGLPAVIPYGVNDLFLKQLSRTIEAWMEVFNLEHSLPFYRVRASIEDKPEVETVERGHFALAFLGNERTPQLLAPIVDPEVIFGQNTSLSAPDAFYARPLAELAGTRQITTGKTPCGFFGAAVSLAPGGSVTLYSLFGHIGSQQALNRAAANWVRPDFIESKRQQARQLAIDLTDPIATETASPLFDGYCRQTFLDNLLRGGWPVMLDGDTPYYVYSRKHGDPERDYNAFSLAAEFYSHGNGNYRDVNQNRRSDVFFQPRVGAHDICTFVNLIQADGYNPLVVRGSTFRLPEDARLELLAMADPPEPLARRFERSFTPGQLLRTLTDHDIQLNVAPQAFLARVIRHARQEFDADFGEGYWVDHWTYNLDLIESYLAIYPEEKVRLLWDAKNLTFYDSFAFVNPRHHKYRLTPEGPRQLAAVTEDPVKEELIASREVAPHQLRTQRGRGEIYRTTLFNKLLTLALVKFATLDPGGMGVEMEAGKPGWYDALNGLPALFGSSMPETFELKRLLQFLVGAIGERGDGETVLPVEVARLLVEVGRHLDRYQLSNSSERDHAYWDSVATAREAYRDNVRMGFDGEERPVASASLADHLSAFLNKVDAGIARAAELNGGAPPTYLAYEVGDYEILPGDPEGPTCIEVKRFRPRVLPLFLEGFVRAMKVAEPAEAAALHRQVRASALYDRKLGMYKVNASLAEEPSSVGRARAFTPGWLENESIWLHMEYKYLLELLKAGLYAEFFEDLQRVLVPFLDPKMYRRSPLENSSFLVSSAHPDEKIHGAGFVARLSGSTAEFLDIWRRMMAGAQPFFVQEGELCLRFAPVLPGWLFDATGRVSFKFLGSCTVEYWNPERQDTFAAGIRIGRIRMHRGEGPTIEISGDTIGTPHAAKIRSGEYPRIEVFFDAEEGSN